ncbi:MAG: putative porin, partial [Phycisphaerae bacterium]|nr:putative porin [Phycisphaerae bacterium]
MLTKGKVLGCLATLIAVAALASPAVAGDTDTVARMANLQQRIEQLEKQLAGRDMERMHRDEMKQMMKEILDDAQMQPALPSWMENLEFYGDLRLRYESRIRSFSDYNGRPGAAADWRDSHKNRNRVRGRLRFGFKKTWWDK